MKPENGFAVVAIFLCLTPSASADQCAYVTKPQAIAAFNNIEIGQKIFGFCEPCGDRTPRELVVRSLSVENTHSPGFWEVQVNGKGIDLAYTYINYNDRRKVNLALVANCSAQDVSPLLTAH